MTMIKICGIRREEEIGAVNRLGPEFIGFVFVRSSARFLEPEKAEALRRMLRPGIRTVGVFRDSTPEEIRQVLEICPVDLVQLHGQERVAVIRDIQRVRPVIRAFSVQTEEDIRQAEKNPADYILLDHASGGTGETFDWKLAENCRRPFFLAGGLGPENVREAMRITGAAVVDASSALETDGRKDPVKMEAFCRAVREGRAAETEE